jgi:hypothetical protein
MAYIDKDDLLKDALSLPTKTKSRSIINEYRSTIIILKLKNYSLKEIHQYLLLNEINIKYKNLSAYLRKYPPTIKEIDEYSKHIDKGTIIQRN